MKAMVSMPTGGRSKDEIDREFNRASTVLSRIGYEVIDTRFEFPHGFLEDIGVTSIPLFYLAKSLRAMASASAVYFVEGWSAARGCRIEHFAAKEYGIATLYEKPEAEE